MTAVAVVADVGLGESTYRVLEIGDHTQTGGGTDHYSHVEVCDEGNVGVVVERIGERYGTRLTEAEP